MNHVIQNERANVLFDDCSIRQKWRQIAYTKKTVQIKPRWRNLEVDEDHLCVRDPNNAQKFSKG